MRRALSQLWLGCTAYARVLPLFGRLGLWRYVALTGLIALALLLAALPLAYFVADATVQWIMSAHQLYASGVHPLLTNLAVFGVMLGLLALFALVYKHVLLVAAGPWMGAVAERVSAHYTELHGGFAVPRQAGAPKGGSAARSIRLNARLLGKETLVSLPLLVASVVPFVNVASTALLFVTQSFYVGVGALDYSAERERDYRSSIAFFNEHKALATGVGIGFVLLLLTGVGVLLAPAWSAAAGAWAYAKTSTPLTRSPSG